MSADGVKDISADSLISRRPNSSFFGFRMRERLATCIERGPAQNRRRSEHERRRKTAPIGDAASRNDRNISYGVYDGWHESHGCTLAPVSSCLRALRHDDLSAITNGSLGACDGLNLRNQRHASARNPRCVRADVAEGQENSAGPPLERHGQKVGIASQSPGNKSDTDFGIRRNVEFPGEPLPVAVTAADQTEATGSTDCRGQRASGNAGHRGREDRHGERELS